MDLRRPTLIDWYITDKSGHPVDKKSFLRMIEKCGAMEYPKYNFGIVGKKLFEGDDPKDAPAIFSNLLSIECKGHGRFRVVTDRCHEYAIHRDNMASKKQIEDIND